MIKRTALAALIALGVSAAAPSAGNAAAVDPAALAAGKNAAVAATLAEPVQYYPRRWVGPRYYAARPAPYWYHRPWVRRPYFGTVIAGITIGTIIGVTAYGLAPPRPRPDLCWYWVDRAMTRGYWDYC